MNWRDMNWTAQDGSEPRDGDVVEIRWNPTTTKRALFGRWRKTGCAIVRVERVDVKGNPRGVFGSERDVDGCDVLRVLQRKGGDS